MLAMRQSDQFSTTIGGVRCWHIAHHSRDTLWRHMSHAQKVAAALMETWGYRLIRVDRDHFREAYLMEGRDGPITTIKRG